MRVFNCVASGSLSDSQIGLEAGQCAREHVLLELFALTDLLLQPVKCFPVKVVFVVFHLASLMLHVGHLAFIAGLQAGLVELSLNEVTLFTLSTMHMM